MPPPAPRERPSDQTDSVRPDERPSALDAGIISTGNDEADSCTTAVIPYWALSVEVEEDRHMRHAACRCGKLSITCADEPVRVSVCHCLECQRRTGSAFGIQARFPLSSVSLHGEYSRFERTSDSGRWARYRFCPSCGSTVACSRPCCDSGRRVRGSRFPDTGTIGF